MNLITFTIPKSYHQKPLRLFLNSFHLSKSNIYKLELNQHIRCKDRVLKNDDRLSEGQQIEIIYQPKDDTIPFKGHIEVLYEDDDIIIVNKPAYLLVHTDGQTHDTLTNRLHAYYKEKSIIFDVFPVHRIDYETSGMVIFAKHFLAQSYFSHLFEKQEIKKYYVCIARHPFDRKSGSIKTKIGKDRHSQKQIISSTGKVCETRYKVIKEMTELSLVEVEIIGGRKHQIRVHLASIGHPILGDKLYGVNQGKRLMLHFKKVEFIHPRTHKAFTFSCQEPFKLEDNHV